MEIDLSKCKKGDTLISSQGAVLEYIAPTPWNNYTYLDHVVRYVKDKDGKSFGSKNYGTRTNDGFVFAKSRIPEEDHDIVEIIKTVETPSEEELQALIAEEEIYIQQWRDSLTQEQINSI